MLTAYFKAPYTLKRLRGGSAGGHMDGLAQQLLDAGYARATACDYLRAAAHLSRWADAAGLIVRAWDESVLRRFERHLRVCRCGRVNVGRFALAPFGARHFLDYLRRVGAVPARPSKVAEPSPSGLPETFLAWMRQHRGVAESTLQLYAPVVAEFLRSVNDDPGCIDAHTLRAFVLRRARKSRPQGQRAVTVLRMFVRHLVSAGIVAAGLECAIPPVRQWRLAALPRFLAAQDIERVVVACNPATPIGARDRAVVLLLARLGLRAGDVAALRLSSIDWPDASLCVAGKGRREVRLPLPQEVGDAILQYLAHRPRIAVDALFLRDRAPLGPITSRAVSTIARRAIGRAGVSAPVSGSHVLRYSAATEMLRQGLSLHEIGRLLRHRSLDMTAHYAKVDRALLRTVVQPWPEVVTC